MQNIFSMVTIKRSQDYTNCAVESFFKKTKLDESDEFFLIDKRYKKYWTENIQKEFEKLFPKDVLSKFNFI